MAQDLDKSNAVGKRVSWYDKQFFDHILQMLSNCNLVYLISLAHTFLMCMLSSQKARCCCFCCSKRSVLLKSSKDLASTLH